MIIEPQTIRSLRQRIETSEYELFYTPLSTEPRHPVVECYICEKKSGRSVRRVGELVNPSMELPFTAAYDLSFVMAAADILGLNLVVEEEVEPEREDNGMADEERSLFDPDEIILFGPLKGLKYSEARKSGEFPSFLKKVADNSNLYFGDDAKQSQLDRLVQLEKLF